MLFNYQTIRVKFERQTRSMSVHLVRSQIDGMMLAELENLLNWLAGHLEVNAVLFAPASDSSLFCQGFDCKELAGLSGAEFKDYLLRLRKIVYGLFHLPQSFVCDLGSGCSGVGIELALGCDIRIARRDSSVEFDFLEKGLVPACGCIGILAEIVGQGFARSWLLGSGAVSGETLLRAGFVASTYSAGEESDAAGLFLRSIARQAPVARIQSKRSLLESVRPQLERWLEYSHLFSFAGLTNNDWKKGLREGGGALFLRCGDGTFFE